jgi:hypothetical protein
MKMKTTKPSAMSTITPGLLSQICFTPFVNWAQFIAHHHTPRHGKNKLLSAPYRPQGVNKVPAFHQSQPKDMRFEALIQSGK